MNNMLAALVAILNFAHVLPADGVFNVTEVEHRALERISTAEEYSEDDGATINYPGRDFEFWLNTRRQKTVRVLLCLPIGNSTEDELRMKMMEVAFTRISHLIEAEWALFFYKTPILTESAYFKEKTVLQKNEPGMLYEYFQKYLSEEFFRDRFYDWLFFMNSDATIENFNWIKFIQILERLRPRIAQPAVIGSFWPNTYPLSKYTAREVEFVEIGPLVAMKPGAWLELRNETAGLMVPDTYTSWGLGMRWCKFLSPGYHKYYENVKCTPERRPICLIVDQTPVIHLNFREARAADKKSDTGYTHLSGRDEKLRVLHQLQDRLGIDQAELMRGNATINHCRYKEVLDRKSKKQGTDEQTRLRIFKGKTISHKSHKVDESYKQFRLDEKYGS